MGRSSSPRPGRRDAPEPRPSLRPELLSGRSLAPPRRSRRELLREHRGKAALVLVVLAVAVGLGAGKFVAERAADSATEDRAAELRELLADATPADFLAFSAQVREEGSLSHQIRHTDGFQNVQANASRAFIRIQPSGWWAGFTERCLVVVVREEGTTITVPKRNCVRVEVTD